MIRIGAIMMTLFLLPVAGGLPENPAPPVRSDASPLPLHVVKTEVRNSRDERVLLRGVNTPSMEWSSDGEGHILTSVKKAIDDWRANIIRLPLAQDRWFGKAPEQKDDGKAYRELTKQVVDLCASRGCYIVLDLHWSDAGEWSKNIGQRIMPDQNSVTFWKDVAGTFANHPAVLFDLYNEPHDVSWDVWLKGGPVKEKIRRTGQELAFEAIGMQTLLNTVRDAGAKNVVIIGGLDWAYDFSGILAGRELPDPKGNGVIYSNHAYPIKGDTVEKWVGKMEAATKKFPVLVGEFGAEARGANGGRAEDWVRQVLQALHDHQDWHWTAWTFHPQAGPRLLSDWDYTPTPSFGKWVKQALDGTLPPYTPPPPLAADTSGPIGVFENRCDVGAVRHPGSVAFDAATRAYTVTGSGQNMWFAADAFQFAWKKARGDISLAASIAMPPTGKDPHRKSCLMIRQSLDPDSAYVDVALHGDGLTSLQFRESKGGLTHEVQSNVTAPARLRIEKRGPYVRLYLSAKEEPLRFSGAAARMVLTEPFLVGIGVCAHDPDAVERAVFSNVEIGASPPTGIAPILWSSLETQSIASTDRRIVHTTPTRIEAPNWLPDGRSLVFNSRGRIYRIPVAGGEPTVIDTGFAIRCNNDHGISPDGRLLAISDQSQGRSLIYTVPIAGGEPKLVTPNGPSYWHGWSPDGKTLAFCGQRDGEFDIYSIPVGGGPEQRLTTAKGLDDGPEFSPDGQFIYFNSERTGRMQIWRMRTDGSNQEHLFADEFNNWFPHVSPDGKQLAFLSYDKDVAGHPENKQVSLRLMNLESKKIDVLSRILGGQGTINVPSWSPDGKRIAFVSYQLIP